MKFRSVLALAMILGLTPILSHAETLNTSAKSQTFLYARGGAGIDGGGSDGLEMENVAKVKGTVTVGIPGAVQGRYGYLRIDGEYGTQQTEKFLEEFRKPKVVRCYKVDSVGNPLANGCLAREIQFELNTTIKLEEGTYQVWFFNTMQFIKVKPGSTQVIELTKIQVPPADEPMEFKIFWDLADPRMQTRVLQVLYSSAASIKRQGARIFLDGDRVSYEQREAFDKVFEKDMARAQKVGRVTALLENTISFSRDGKFELGNFGFDYRWLTYENSFDAGEFVSVMPGTYGIEFLNKTTGQTMIQSGIVAQ